MNQKNVKITKLAHSFKAIESSYNFEILNSFNPELQFKNAECAIKNKLKKILTGLKGLKFVKIPVLLFKKIEVMIKQSMRFFMQSRKEK